MYVCSLSYSMPTRKCVILRKLQNWLQGGAVWQGTLYTLWVQPDEKVLYAYNTIWNADYTTPQVMMSGLTVCVHPPGNERYEQNKRNADLLPIRLLLKSSTLLVGRDLTAQTQAPSPYV